VFPLKASMRISNSSPPMLDIRPAHLILLDLITQIKFYESTNQFTESNVTAMVLEGVDSTHLDQNRDNFPQLFIFGFYSGGKFQGHPSKRASQEGSFHGLTLSSWHQVPWEMQNRLLHFSFFCLLSYSSISTYTCICQQN